MGEQEFWEIIERASRSADAYEHIRAELSRRSRDEIVGFHTILSTKIAEAYTFPLLAANFAIESYVSDDGFQAFRAWLVTQGRERFTRALTDPESIADWLDPATVDEIDGSPMLSVAADAYADTYGNETEFDQLLAVVPQPEMVQDWPSNKVEFRARWPRLVDTFWNAERIREMHTD